MKGIDKIALSNISIMRIGINRTRDGSLIEGSKKRDMDLRGTTVVLNSIVVG